METTPREELNKFDRLVSRKLKPIESSINDITDAVSVLADVVHEIPKKIGIPKDGKNGLNGKDGKDGKNGQDGIDGVDGSPDTGKEIKTKLEALQGDSRLDKSAIKGLESVSTQADIDRAVSILDTRTQYLINKVSNSSGAGGTPSAPDTSVQYNNAGSFFGDVTFTRDPVTNATLIAAIPNGTDGMFIDIRDTSLSLGYTDTPNSFRNGFQVQTNGSSLVGDIVQGFNKTLLTVDDAAQTFISSGTFPNTAVSHGLRLDFASGLFGIGDVSDVSSKMAVIVNDADQLVTVGNNVNGAYIIVDDSNSTISNHINGDFSVKDVSNQRWLSIVTNGGSQIAQMGDVDYDWYGTKIVVNDSTKTISAITNDTFKVTDTSGAIWMDAYVSNHRVSIGDFDLTNNTYSYNGLRVIVKDDAKEISVDSRDGQLILGDADAGYNGTRIIVDDTTKDIIFNTDGLTTHSYDISITAKVSLNAGQIQTFGSVPVQVIAAPGAGKAIQVLSCFYNFTFGTVAYTAYGTPGLTFDPSSGYLFQKAAGNTLSLPSGTTTVGMNSASGYGFSGDTWENAPVYFTDDDNSDPATGDGTLILYITYKIVNL